MWPIVKHILFLFAFSDHRLFIQPNDSDDGVAIDPDGPVATNDEWSRNQEGNGKHEPQ